MDCCKVGVVANKREVTVNADENVHDYLVARWLGLDQYPAKGVRKLAEWFNKKLLRDAYTAHGRTVTDVRITSEYEALTGDDEVEKGEIIDDLQSDGIDGEQLVDDFVSRSTMRRHLTECLGASKDTPDSTDSETNWEIEQVQRSKEYLRAKVDESVRSLANKGQLPGGADADVDISIVLSCPDCSTQVRLQTALEREYICQTHHESTSLTNSEIVNSPK